MVRRRSSRDFQIAWPIGALRLTRGSIRQSIRDFPKAREKSWDGSILPISICRGH